MLEFLLINHPLDCPICDKGGQCPLQNRRWLTDVVSLAVTGVKRTYPKPINISAQVLDRELRAVLRCTRFADQPEILSSACRSAVPSPRLVLIRVTTSAPTSPVTSSRSAGRSSYQRRVPLPFPSFRSRLDGDDL